MKTEAHSKKEYVPLHRGMCIRGRFPYEINDVDVFSDTFTDYYNPHPWIIVSETEESIEIIMAQTLESQAEGKHKFLSLLNMDWTMELLSPCPPMDNRGFPDFRRQCVDAKTVMTVPKKIVYEDDKLEICNNEGYFLSDVDMKRIDALIRKYFEKYEYLDPHDLWKTEEIDYPIDDYLNR